MAVSSKRTHDRVAPANATGVVARPPLSPRSPGGSFFMEVAMTRDEGLWLTLWAGAAVAIGAADKWRDGRHDGTTISELTRRLPNRFTAMAVGAAAGWFVAHICDPKGRSQCSALPPSM